MNRYLKLIRVHHYIKNILIFLPAFFEGVFFDTNLLKVNFMGFLSFCFAASFIYIINDILDVEQDKLHPIKSKRPIASGSIEKKNAVILAIILIIASGICNYFINNQYFAWMLWGIYIAINILYSFGLKKIPIVDVIILSIGFAIRVLYGVVISGINVPWLLIANVFIGALYMGIGKRRNELKNQGQCVRHVLKYYNYKVMNITMFILFVMFICFYLFWCVSSVMQEGMTAIVYISIPVIFAVIARYSKDIEEKMDGDPINVLIKDKLLMLGGAIYVFLMFYVIYL